jgi:glycerophosphoryl diester phosphodiesterase
MRERFQAGPRRPWLAGVALLLCTVSVIVTDTLAQSSRKMLVAHRGASAYAPEHTIAAYKLAIEQGADYVEQDLQISKDGVLVCLHDLTLERTTNVEEVFPDRAATVDGRPTWNVSDFTLQELKRLDAGSWFKPGFKGERIPTFQEAIDVVRGKAGIYPETKEPEVYGARGFDMAALTLAVLAKNGLDRPGSDPKTPVIIQSFSADSLRLMRKAGSTLPLVFLISNLDKGAPRWLTDAGLKMVREFAVGIGPAKALVTADPTIVSRAHAAGLTVTPYTFRTGATPDGMTVRQEMADFLFRLGVDALFTDNPDQFPR